MREIGGFELVFLQRLVLVERLHHVLSAVETVGFQDIDDAPIEALDHAVGFGCPGLGQMVLDAGCFIDEDAQGNACAVRSFCVGPGLRAAAGGPAAAWQGLD